MAREWTRPELVIVVAAMHEDASGGEWKGIRAGTVRASEVSALLRSSVIHADGPSYPTFRSTNSIHLKSENLRTARSDYNGLPTRGSHLDLEVVADFQSSPEGVLAEAAAARELLTGGSTAGLPTTEDDELLVAEGKAIMRQHLTRERARGLRAKKIESVQQAGLPIACEVCGLDYGKTYGSRGTGCIEVHHVRPLHDSGPTKTALGDLALLCANCHRMIHRNPWVTPAQLKASMP